MTGKKRSEKRQATEIRRARFTPEEAAEFDAKAKEYGGDSAFIRARTIGAPLPPRATSKAELVKVRAAFAAHRADLGKIGSNLNQLAYRYNLTEGRPAGNIEGALLAALEEWSEAVRTIDELRLVGLQAMGYERKRKPPKNK